jgi:hypothetical protein
MHPVGKYILTSRLLKKNTNYDDGAALHRKHHDENVPINMVIAEK